MHFYNKGHSRRGPSLRVPFESLKRAKCDPLVHVCLAQLSTESIAGSPGSSSNSCAIGSESSFPSSTGSKYEVYIPCLEDTPRGEAFAYHLTTRNFFAWMFGKPLVGSHLGESLVDLLERMILFRNEEADNVQDFTIYLEESGYLDFAGCPDYALAILSFAEHFRLRDLWIDAFVHCVGMNETLYLSPEFEVISRLSKALITRAYLEMDLHLGRVSRTLSNFLEDDLSSSHLGLSDSARTHLDRFRSFLHSYHVNKFGYWPPPEGSRFPKHLYRSMYYEFSKLYSYLADTETVDVVQKAASGGICVLQNVEAFDGRHKFDPLPYQLPLLPEYESLEKRTQSQKGLRSLRLSSRDTKQDRKVTVRSALAAATNSDDESITSCRLVQEYAQFERELSFRPEEKVSIADARKVRWLLVYGVVQVLISVTRAPAEVRDTEGPTYPLCCLTAGTPPWAFSSKLSLASPTESPTTPSSPVNTLATSQELDIRPTSSISIHPDCETDNYFANTPLNRRANTDPACVPRPLRPLRSRTSTSSSTSIARNSSIKKSIRLPKRFSQKQASSTRTVPLNRSSQFCEILVHGYGNGLNEASVDSTQQVSLDIDRPERSRVDSPTGPFELDATPTCSTQCSEAASKPQPAARKVSFSEQAREARTPILNPVQLEGLSRPFSWEEGLESLSVGPIPNLPNLSISIYDIAAATAAGTIPTAPPSSASSNYSRDSHPAASVNSHRWSTESASDFGTDPTSASFSLSDNAGQSRKNSVGDEVGAAESSNPPPLEMDHVSIGTGSERSSRLLSVSNFAKMLVPEEASDYGGNVKRGDSLKKNLEMEDSMESLRARYMGMDIFCTPTPDFEESVVVAP